jgi:hypothetical protein
MSIRESGEALFAEGQAEARPCKDVTQVYLRDATVLHSAGGMFSVALSVSCSGTGLKTRHYRLPWRYQARCPLP